MKNPKSTNIRSYLKDFFQQSKSFFQLKAKDVKLVLIKSVGLWFRGKSKKVYWMQTSVGRNESVSLWFKNKFKSLLNKPNINQTTRQCIT